MSTPVCLRVLAEARSDLLCRLLGLLAQFDLPAPAMVVTVRDGLMQVDLTMEHFGRSLAVMQGKMSRFVGVTWVGLAESHTD